MSTYKIIIFTLYMLCSVSFALEKDEGLLVESRFQLLDLNSFSNSYYNTYSNAYTKSLQYHLHSLRPPGYSGQSDSSADVYFNPFPIFHRVRNSDRFPDNISVLAIVAESAKSNKWSIIYSQERGKNHIAHFGGMLGDSWRFDDVVYNEAILVNINDGAKLYYPILEGYCPQNEAYTKGLLKAKLEILGRKNIKDSIKTNEDVAPIKHIKGAEGDVLPVDDEPPTPKP